MWRYLACFCIGYGRQQRSGKDKDIFTHEVCGSHGELGAASCAQGIDSGSGAQLGQGSSAPCVPDACLCCCGRQRSSRHQARGGLSVTGSGQGLEGYQSAGQLSAVATWQTAAKKAARAAVKGKGKGKQSPSKDRAVQARTGGLQVPAGTGEPAKRPAAQPRPLRTPSPRRTRPRTRSRSQDWTEEELDRALSKAVFQQRRERRRSPSKDHRPPLARRRPAPVLSPQPKSQLVHSTAAISSSASSSAPAAVPAAGGNSIALVAASVTDERISVCSLIQLVEALRR